MKKLIFALILVLAMSAMLPSCGTKKEVADPVHTSGDSTTEITTNITTEIITDTTTEITTDNAPVGITKEMAYDGVYNYCHSVYDWSVAEENPDIMYVQMGEETESEYRVIFRSYTGSFVYFYVDKASGNTRLVEYVPNLNIEEEAGNINLYDYLESAEK